VLLAIVQKAGRNHVTTAKQNGGAFAPRVFLFLQGPASQFFSHLGQALAQHGHGVHRINFHGGDQLFWRLPGAVNYRGHDRNWPSFLEATILDYGVTDIILFGDCRPRHRAAITVARRLQRPVHVFEEGYIRPNWVTFELGGVNGHSSLPRDPGWYREQASRLEEVPESGNVASSFARRATEDLAYNFGYMLLGWSFPFCRTHRPWHPLVEYSGWAARLVRRRLQSAAIAAEVTRADTLKDFYVFPLQLDCDSQVRQHSAFGGMTPAIETVLTSFAAHAPASATLLVKEHPLDNGLRNWRRRLAEIAARLGINDRICYIEDGDLERLTRSARGMVTINSTSGTLALAAGVPVMTLGQAVYDMPGLTFQGSLDAFWTEAAPPDLALFAAFRRVLAHRCLVRGGFFSTGAVRLLTEGSVARLEALPAAHAVAGVRTAASLPAGEQSAQAVG
jgi:capsular polysaccharide export protein